MSDKSKEQNHQQNVDEPEQKRRKPNESESEAEVIEPKAITNIYYDCLERIFDFLDLKSLLMVADTCKRLQIAAAAKFGDEYGGKKIWLHPRIQKPMVIVEQNYIEVYDLKFCLAFLRCFGAKISGLTIYYYNLSRTTEEYLDQYINQYCADPLTSIEFRAKLQFSNKAFPKPFKNAEKVKIGWCYLENQLQNFTNWFPKLRCLEMINCSIGKTASLNIFFPQLEHLQIHITDDRYKFRIEDAADLLHANSQLQSLTIWWDSEWTLDKILDVIRANSMITKLKVIGYDLLHPFLNVNRDELTRFVVEHPLVEQLIFDDHCLTAADAINFIHQMNALKRIEFQVDGQAECDLLLNQLEQDWKSEAITVGSRGIRVKLNR